MVHRTPVCMDFGGYYAQNPSEIFLGDAAITMLADDDAVRATILDRGILRTANKRLVHVVMSTLSVALARELEHAHAEAGIAYVAAPVMGGPEAAAAGKLNVLAAGEPAAIERVTPLFNATGQRTWLLGATPHHANVVKLA